jgi:hypothetical protein
MVNEGTGNEFANNTITASLVLNLKFQKIAIKISVLLRSKEKYKNSQTLGSTFFLKRFIDCGLKIFKIEYLAPIPYHTGAT